MKKVLSTLLLLMAFCVPWVTQAQCDPIGTFPIAYGFETSEGFTSSSNPTTNTLGTCWGNVATVPEGTTAERLWYVSTSNKHSGSQALCLPDKHSGNVTVLTFPAMNFTYSNGYLLTIWVYRNASGSSSPNEGVRVYASNTNTVTASSVELGFLYRNCTQTDGNIVTAESATGWYQYEFPITLTGTVYLIFQGESSYGSATYLDDITIEQMPTCQHPYNVVASNFETDGATLSWTPSGNGETSYQYVCVPVGETPNWNNATIVNAPTVTLTGLGASSVYDFYVRSYCSAADQSSAIQGQFRTACGMLTLPFFTDFESEAAGGANANNYPNFIPCWTRLNDATSANYQGYPYIYNTTSAGYTHSGTKLLYLYSYKGTLTTYPYFDMAVMPQLNTAVNPANGLRLKFWGRSNTSSASPDVTIGVMSDPEDESTFETVTTLTLTGTTMTEYVVPLTSYTGTGAYVAFRCDRNEIYSAAAYIDDVTLESMPTCLDPSALTVNSASITNSSCQLSWTNGASETQWNVRYKAAGDTAWTLSPTIATTNPYTLTGLAPATTYSIQVRAYCSDTDQSPWSNVVEMTTFCLPFEMPLVEDFNDLTEGIPNCWYNNEGTTTNDDYKWNYYATGYDGACLRFNSYNNSTNNTNVLVSPAITLTSHAVLNFVAKDPAGGEFSVLAGVSGSSTRDTLVSSIRGVADWTEYDIDLNAYTGQTVVIYFCGTSNYGSNDAYLYLDNFSITAVPTCIKPTAITFNDITAHTASVAWTSRGDETAWNLRYKETTDTTWIEIPSTVTNPYTLSGLEANTYYDVQVRSYCSAVDQSDWTFTETFLTGCDVISSFPWVEGFELVATGSTTSPAPNCWDALNANIGGNPPYAYVTTGSSAHTGNKYIYMANYNGSYGRGFLVFPEFSAPLNTLQVSFWYKNNSTNPSTTCHVTLGYIADVTDSATFVALQELPLTTSWTEFTYFLSNVPARGNARLALRYGDNTQLWSGPNAYIDDITIDLLPTCIRPSDIAVTTTLNSATVSWTSNGTETAWNLRYKASADTSWIEVPSTVTNPYTISGLTPSTSYDVQVRSYCSAEEQSEWCPTFTFKTDFGVPFSESFNVTSIPAEWTIMTGSPDNAFAGTNPTSTTGGWMIKTTSNGLPANHLGINIYNSSTNKWFVSPNIDATGVLSNMVLTFDFAYTDWNNASNPDAGSNQALYVLVSTDNGATWSSANSWAWAHNSTSSAAVTEDLALIPTTGTTLGIDFSRFAGQMVKFAFVATSQSGDNDFHIANVILREGSMTARNVVAISADSTMGTVTGGGSYIDGCEVTLTAVPNSGYLFSQWNDGNTDNPRTIVVNSDTNFVATFVPCQTIVVNAANPFIEDFEAGIFADCWSQEYVSGTQDWIFAAGDGSGVSSAHSGSLNAQFQGNSYDGITTKMVLPPFDLSALDSAKLSFWHTQAVWTPDQNELHVYYRTAANGTWTSLANYTNSITSWTEEVIILPNIGSYYQLAFEGVNNYGHHIALDDITVETASTEPTPTVYDTVYLPNYQTTYYLADNDWFSVLYNDAQDTIFYFDIVADELVSGTTYTLANMLVNFSEVEFNSNAIAYTDASFTFTRNLTTNRDNVTAVVSLTDGQNFVVIYDAEIDTGMQYDTRNTDFVRNYTLAETELDDDYFTTYGVVDLSATASDMSSTIAIEFNVASLDADIIVPEGVYPINNSEMSGTVLASPGVVGGYIYPSFAATMTASGDLDEAWFMENGTVTVRKVNGLFTALVEATNSYGRNIHILIGDTNAVVVPDSVTFVVSVNDTAMGTVNPMGTVRYAVGDTVTAIATANEGYHFVDWTVTVVGFSIPMTENPLSYVARDLIPSDTVNVVANFAPDSVPPTPVVYDTVYVSDYEKIGFGSGDWLYQLYNSGSDTTFSFNIIADSIVYGHTYTMTDMFFGFSRMYIGDSYVEYSAASFTHTRNEATQRENITAAVTLATGQSYVVIYDAEIDTGLRYDTRDSDFVHNYTLAEAEFDDDYFTTYGVVDLYVTASDLSSAVAIEFNVASIDADISIPEGVYPINTSNLAGTVVASPGVISSRVYPSYVAGIEGNYLSEPFWFMENGTITVRKVNGLFTALVEATNSYGRNIHILIGDTNAVVAPDSVTFVVSVNDAAMGTVNPMGTVRYAVGDSVTATATANEGYHFVDWTMTVMGMPIPMTENPLSYVIPAIIANQTVNVVANFAPDSVPPAADSVTINIAVNDPAMGTVDPMGTVRYAVGETVSATATANDGYHFVNWSISVMGMTIPMTENPLTYEIPAFIPAMAADMTVDVIANFAADSVPPATDSVTINISVNDPAMGTVDPIGTVRYAVGETVSATATANDGYHFVNWSISVMGMPVPIPMTENPLAYTIPAMAANMTVDVTANFEADSIGISQFNTSTPQQINIYPNPANSVANVKVSGVNGKVNVAVLDMNGRVVMNDSMECDGEAVKSLNIESLAQGAYFVRIYGEDFNSIQKLIVR